jgi:hypothetical protein
MGRGSCKFRQRDVSKAIKGVRAAGFEVARVEIDTEGKIVIIPGTPNESVGDQKSEPNEWDDST